MPLISLYFTITKTVVLVNEQALTNPTVLDALPFNNRICCLILTFNPILVDAYAMSV